VTISGTLLTLQLDVSTGRFPVLFKSIYRTKDTSLYRIILEITIIYKLPRVTCAYY